MFRVCLADNLNTVFDGDTHVSSLQSKDCLLCVADKYDGKWIAGHFKCCRVFYSQLQCSEDSSEESEGEMNANH